MGVFVEETEHLKTLRRMKEYSRRERSASISSVISVMPFTVSLA